MRHKNPTPRPQFKDVVAATDMADDILHCSRKILSVCSVVLPATPVPGLGTAAAALISLIDKIMIVKQNEYIRRDVAQSINALAISIDQAGSQINGRFGDAVECDMPKIKATLESSSLNSQVQTLLTTLRELTIEADQLSPDNQSFGWRFIRGDGNAKILTRIKDRLADARSRFIIQAQVVIGELVNGVDDKVASIRRAQREQGDENALEALPRADASYCSYLNSEKSEFYADARDDLLREIEGWSMGCIDDHDLNKKQLYILSGASGTGKSTIAYEVARRLEAQGLLGASFFFARGAEGLNSPRLFFSTIAYQLARLQPTIYPFVVLAAKSHQKRGCIQHIQSEYEDLVKQPLLRLPTDHRPVVLIIDALDECEGAQDRVPQMLRLLLDCIHVIPFLRILITTRPSRHVEGTLRSVSPETVKWSSLDCEPQGAVDADIMGFLSRSLCGIPYCAEIVRDLTKKAGGLFVYAKFAVDLFRNNPDLVDENLQKLQENSDAHALDKLYLTILHNAFPKCVLDSGTNRNHVQKVLAGTVLLQDRCSVHTLASLITVGAQHVREILLQLNPVIHFDRSDPDSTVYPLHVSFSDFILSSERCGDRNFYIDAQVYHRLFATRCLSIMNQWEALCRNPLSLSNPSVFKNSIEDLPTRVKGYIPAVTQYACLHWATHLCASHRTQKDDPQLRGLLRTFCSEKLLVWLEALSFMDRLDIAPTALKNARDWYQDDDDIRDLLNDGYRFVLEYYVPINSCPNHIYVSALPLMPHCSLLETYFSPNSTDVSVKLLTPRDPHWSQCLRVTEGVYVTAMEFTADGKWIAASGRGEELQTIDAATGIACRVSSKKETKDIVAVQYSLDNTQITTAGGKTVQVWNRTSGALTHTLHTGTDSNITAIAYSRDGGAIITGSGNSLHRWSLQGGELLRSARFRIDGGCIRAIYPLSGGSKAIASGKQTLYVLDEEQRTIIHTLDGHTGNVLAAAFFPDGNRFASCSSDRTVRVWDTEPTRCIYILYGHTDEVSCIGVSASGTIIASGSRDYTVRLWDARSGQMLATLQDHMGWIESICFSPSGDRLASSSTDGTVRLWDLTKGDPSQATATRMASINCMVLSKDGALVASGSHDGTVAIWILATGRLLRRFVSGTEIRNVMFSGDATRILTAGQRRVTVWDLKTGLMLRQVHCEAGVEYASLSLDAKHFFTAEGSMLTVWDVDTVMRRARRLQSSLESVAYSPDGVWVATCTASHSPANASRTITLLKAADFSPKWTYAFDKCPRASEAMGFVGDSVYVITNRGQTVAWRCSNREVVAVPGEQHLGKFYEQDGWICSRKTKDKLCWLPATKRATLNTLIHGNYYILGTDGGHFSILDLSSFSS